jgi:hypothetical protein
LFASQHPVGHDAASQRHCPCAVQLWPELHALQTPPLVPQAVADGVMHVPFEQHPVHAPPPHEHLPLLHVEPEEHVTHACPAAPHALVDVPPTQWP